MMLSACVRACCAWERVPARVFVRACVRWDLRVCVPARVCVWACEHVGVCDAHVHAGHDCRSLVRPLVPPCRRTAALRSSSCGSGSSSPRPSLLCSQPAVRESAARKGTSVARACFDAVAVWPSRGQMWPVLAPMWPVLAPMWPSPGQTTHCVAAWQAVAVVPHGVLCCNAVGLCSDGGP
jgi:hypothetical protein